MIFTLLVILGASELMVAEREQQSSKNRRRPGRAQVTRARPREDMVLLRRACAVCSRGRGVDGNQGPEELNPEPVRHPGLYKNILKSEPLSTFLSNGHQ